MAVGFGGGAACDNDVAMISATSTARNERVLDAVFLGEEQWRKAIMARVERGGLGG